MNSSVVKVATLVSIKSIVFKLFKIKYIDEGYNFADLERTCIWFSKAFLIYWIDSLMMMLIASQKTKKWVVLAYMGYSLVFIFWKTGVFSVHDTLVLDEFTIGLLYIALLMDYLFTHGKDDIRHTIDTL